MSKRDKASQKSAEKSKEEPKKAPPRKKTEKAESARTAKKAETKEIRTEEVRASAARSRLEDEPIPIPRSRSGLEVAIKAAYIAHFDGISVETAMREIAKKYPSVSKAKKFVQKISEMLKEKRAELERTKKSVDEIDKEVWEYAKHILRVIEYYGLDDARYLEEKLRQWEIENKLKKIEKREEPSLEELIPEEHVDVDVLSKSLGEESMPEIKNVKVQGEKEPTQEKRPQVPERQLTVLEAIKVLRQQIEQAEKAKQLLAKLLGVPVQQQAQPLTSTFVSTQTSGLPPPFGVPIEESYEEEKQTQESLPPGDVFRLAQEYVTAIEDLTRKAKNFLESRGYLVIRKEEFDNIIKKKLEEMSEVLLTEERAAEFLKKRGWKLEPPYVPRSKVDEYVKKKVMEILSKRSKESTGDTILKEILPIIKDWFIAPFGILLYRHLGVEPYGYPPSPGGYPGLNLGGGVGFSYPEGYHGGRGTPEAQRGRFGSNATDVIEIGGTTHRLFESSSGKGLDNFPPLGTTPPVQPSTVQHSHEEHRKGEEVHRSSGEQGGTKEVSHSGCSSGVSKKSGTKSSSSSSK